MRTIRWALLVVPFFLPGWAAAEDITPGHLLGEVVRLVEREHVDAGQVSSRALLEGALDGVVEQFPQVEPEAHFEAGRFRLELRAGPRALRLEGAQPASLAGLAPLLARTAEFLQENLSPTPSTQTVALALGDGLLRRLDERSRLLSPAGHAEFRRALDGKSEGIGLLLQSADGGLVVRGVLPGSPAQRRGLAPGEPVALIDWVPARTMTPAAAEHRLRGPPGSQVTLHLGREDAGPLKKFVLTRAAFPIPSVGSHLFEEGSEQWVGYVRVTEFQGATALELGRHLSRLYPERPGFLGIILDLRSNPGGVMEEALHTADRFLNRGVIVTPVRARGASLPVRARGYSGVTTAPMVVLVDRHSASGAEIVAAALAGNRRALVIGHRTVGKGTVQSVIPLSAGYAVSLTVARLLTPAGHAIQSQGVEPHIALLPVRVEGERVRFETLSTPEAFPAPGDRPLADLQYLSAGAAPGVPLPAQAHERERFLRSDFAVRLARQVLVFNRGGAYPALVRNALEVLRGVQAREQRRIAGALGRLGIDWGEGVPLPGGRVAITGLSAEVSPGGAGRRWARLALDVVNQGTEEVHQVRVRLTGDEDFLDSLDLPLGLLHPGEKRSPGLRIPLPPDLPGGVRRVGAQVVSQGGHVLHEGSLLLAIPPPEPPVLRVHAAFAGSHAGNEGTAPATVALEISNTGRGSSGALQAVLRPAGRKGVALVSHLLAPLQPGGRHRVTLSTAGTAGWGKSRVVLEVIDRDHPGAGLRKMVPPRGAFTLQKPSIELAPLPLREYETALNLAGRVVDDKSPGSVTVLLNQRRVLHRVNPAGGLDEPLSFSLDAHLRQGSNEIRIQSRDREALVTERRLVFWRGPGRELAGDRWFQVLQ